MSFEGASVFDQGFSRRRFLAGAGLLGVGAALRPVRSVAQAVAADPLDALRARLLAPSLTKTQLAEGIWLIQGDGGNIAVSTGKDGKLVIDSGVRPGATPLMEALKSIDSAPVRQVVNTHWHLDHTDGNPELRADGATIVAHRNTLKRMSSSNYLEPLNITFPPAPVAARPTVTFDETKTIPWNGETLVLTHVQPAHTDSDIYIVFPKANVIHAGDVFFAGAYPLIDRNTGGRIDGMIAASDVLLKVSDAKTKIIPGHGPLQNRAGLQSYRDMLATVRDRVAKAKAQGKSLEEVQASKPTADFDGSHKGMLSGDQFVKLVYQTV